jgi:hypothetical protein
MIHPVTNTINAQTRPISAIRNSRRHTSSF